MNPSRSRVSAHHGHRDSEPSMSYKLTQLFPFGFLRGPNRRESSRRRFGRHRRRLVAAESLEMRRLLAATAIEVTTFGDVSNETDSVVSLREAVMLANSNPEGAEIVLAPGVYRLTLDGANEDAAATGDLDITGSGPVTIRGASANETTIDASGLGDRILEVAAGASLNLRDLTLRGGDTGSSKGGGAVHNAGSLRLESSRVAGNSGSLGGGVSSTAGDVELVQTTFDGNSASGLGGAVAIRAGTLNIESSVFSHNESGTRGGALSLSLNHQDAVVVDSQFSHNSARRGGAIAWESGLFELRDASLSGNDARDMGGGIYTDSDSGTMRLVNSTVDANMAGQDGGGIYALDGSLDIVSTTVSGNEADRRGGGVFAYRGELDLIGSTITGNSAVRQGGGIRHRAETTLQHTIVAGNYLVTPILPDDISGTRDVSALSSHNLIGHAASANGLQDGVLGNVVGQGGAGLIDIDDILKPLADNGGPTLTHTLAFGSPALNAGDTAFDGLAFNPPIQFDQRGFDRVIGGRIDIGAVEFEIAERSPGGSIDLDEPILTRLANPQDVHEWTFSGEMHQTIAIVADPGANQASLGAVDLQLVGPGDQLVAAGASPATGEQVSLFNIALPADGVYRLRTRAADANLDATGYYQFTVWNIAPLQLDQTSSATVSWRQSRFFRVQSEAGNPLVLDLDAPPTSDVELYVQRGRLPALDDFEATTRGADPRQLVLPSEPQAATYYVMLYAADLEGDSATVDLTASAPDFVVHTSDFGTAGNAGDFTIHASGADFDSKITARLSDPSGFSRDATSLLVQSPTDLYATFDLRGVAPGVFDVEFTDGTGGDGVSVPQSLKVVAAGEPAVIPNVVAPSGVRREREFSFTVEWRNNSFNDVPAPLLTVGATVPFGLGHDDDSLGSSYTFLGINTQGGPAGVLRPSQHETLTFWAYSGPELGDYIVYADRNISDPSAAFDWQSATSRVRPAGMTETEAAAVVTLLQSHYGADAGGYLGLLAAAANASPEATRDPKQLLHQEMLRAWSQTSAGIWGSIAASEPGAASGLEVIATQTATGDEFAVRADALGRFHFTQLPDGIYGFAIEGYEIAGGDQLTAEISQGQSAGPISLQIAPASMFQVQVDLFDGQPISDAIAVLLDGDQQVATGLTDASGTATFWGVAPGVYTLRVSELRGSIRQHEGLAIPDAPASLAEVDLASAVVRGAVADPAALFPVLTPTSGAAEVAHAVVAENGDFEIHVSGGEHRLLVFDANGNQVRDLGLFDLTPGATIDVGLIAQPSPATAGGSGQANGPSAASGALWFDDPDAYVRSPYVANLPVSTPAKINITVSGYRDPDVVERVLARGEVLPFVKRLKGAEYAKVVRQYLDGGGSRQFTDGHEFIEGAAGAVVGDSEEESENTTRGFRGHSKTEGWLRLLLEHAQPNIENLITSGEISLSCGGATSLNIADPRVILPDDENGGLLLYQDGNDPAIKDTSYDLDYKSTIAGGVGHFGSPVGSTPQNLGYVHTPDRRLVDAGQVHISVDATGNYSAQLEGVQLHVLDAFDLWPGNLGEFFHVKYATTILLYLEFNGRADDLVFDAIWTDDKTRKIQLDVPSLTCDPRDDPPDDLDIIGRPTSSDPNDIVGPAGVGPLNHVVADGLMPYTIRFENDAQQATAPAALVTITQTLDPNLDWATVRLGDLGFGSTVVDVPLGATSFQNRVDLTGTHGVFVDIDASVDPSTGELRWDLLAIDPATGEPPEDPLVGFLPPNVNGPEGEGWVTYTVLPRATQVSGARIDAEATIVFDVNDPIITPAIFHTLDAAPPTSEVASLPTSTTDPEFTVQWGGVDDAGGAGVDRYDVYVSEDGGPWVRWLRGSTETSTMYQGALGKTYAFYSVARDLVGHWESPPAEPDAVIEVEPFSGQLPKWMAPDSTAAQFRVASLDGVSLVDGDSPNEVFDLELASSNGWLRVSDDAMGGVPRGGIGGIGQNRLTLSGTLSAVNATLATLEFYGWTPGAVTIDLRASSSQPTAVSDFEISVSANAFPWHNEPRPHDVDADGIVGPEDIVAVVADLEINRPRALPEPPPGTPPAGYWDVDRDNLATTSDLVELIAHYVLVINSGDSEGDGEGDVSSSVAPLSAAAVAPWRPTFEEDTPLRVPPAIQREHWLAAVDAVHGDDRSDLWSSTATSRRQQMPPPELSEASFGLSLTSEGSPSVLKRPVG